MCREGRREFVLWRNGYGGRQEWERERERERERNRARGTRGEKGEWGQDERREWAGVSREAQMRVVSVVQLSAKETTKRTQENTF
jgi:hypothetical protein